MIAAQAAAATTARTSYSAITEHRSCPQAWHFRHVQRFERDETNNVPVELDYGTWWHAVLAAEAIGRGRAAGSLVYAPTTIQTPYRRLPVEDRDGVLLTPQDVIHAAGTWFDSRPGEVAMAWEDRLGITDLRTHLAHRFSDWREVWTDELSTEEPLAVELWWEREIPGSGGLVLVGLVDLVYRDTARGLVGIRDCKTGKSLDQGSTSLGDMMDGQLHLYAWGAAPMLAKLGIAPARVVGYDRARSRAAKEPKLTNAGKLASTVKDFSVFDYARWAELGPTYPGTKKDGSGAGTYEVEESVMARLGQPDELRPWFQRSIDLVNHNVIAAHLEEAAHTAADMDRTRATATPGRNLTRACQWCPYAKLCRSQMIGGRDGEYDLAVLGLRKKENA